MYYITCCKWSMSSVSDISKMHSLYGLYLSAIKQIGTDWRKPFCGAPFMIYTFVRPLTRLYVCNHDWSVERYTVKFMCRSPPLTIRSVNTRRFTYRWENAIMFFTLYRSTKKCFAFLRDQVKKENYQLRIIEFCSTLFFYPRTTKRNFWTFL